MAAAGHSQGAGGAIRAATANPALIDTVVTFSLPSKTWVAANADCPTKSDCMFDVARLRQPVFLVGTHGAFDALIASASTERAFYDHGEVGEPMPADSGKNGQKTDELAEAAKALPGAAGNAECVTLGTRVVRFLWTDDLDAAFKHLDLYDRFGCPASHVQAAYRCVVMQGTMEGKSAETLKARSFGCWINPTAGAPQQEAPATTTGNPARR